MNPFQGPGYPQVAVPILNGDPCFLQFEVETPGCPPSRFVAWFNPNVGVDGDPATILAQNASTYRKPFTQVTVQTTAVLFGHAIPSGVPVTYGLFDPQTNQTLVVGTSTNPANMLTLSSAGPPLTPSFTNFVPVTTNTYLRGLRFGCETTVRTLGSLVLRAFPTAINGVFTLGWRAPASLEGLPVLSVTAMTTRAVC